MKKEHFKMLAEAPRNIWKHGTGELTPKQIMFSVTNRCNSRCHSCSIWSQQPKLREMTPEETYKVLHHPLFKDVKFIINSGGEPTVRKDIKELLLAEHWALPEAKLQVSTNALLPDRVLELVEFCNNHGFDIEVGTSLNGTGEAHDITRGRRGSFGKVDYLIRELQRRKKCVAVGFVLTEETAPNLPGLIEYLKQFNLEPLVQWYNQAPFYSNKEGKVGTKEALDAIRRMTPSPTYELWERKEQGKEAWFPCYTLETFTAMKCDGTITPCLRMWDVEVGNVLEKDAWEVWRGERAKEVRGMVRECEGCLNSWAVEFSYCATMYPFLLYYLRNPKLLAKRLLGGV